MMPSLGADSCARTCVKASKSRVGSARFLTDLVCPCFHSVSRNLIIELKSDGERHSSLASRPSKADPMILFEDSVRRGV